MLTQTQMKIVATRLATTDTHLFLSDGNLRSANTLKQQGLLTNDFYGLLERKHLTSTLVNAFFAAKAHAFLVESLSGDFLVFEGGKFFTRFYSIERNKAERTVMGLEALRLQQAA